MSTRTVNFPLMDSIRGIALLSVVAAHTGYFVSLDGVEAITKVRFDFGVRVFFLISAFLLYRPFVRARLRGDPRPSLRAYAWRRLLRIAPAYWVALTVVGVWLSLPNLFTATGIPTYYGFAQIYRPSTAVGGLPQAWSLCVEVVFYAFLPAYAAVLRLIQAPSRRWLLGYELAGAGVLFAMSGAYKALIVGAGTLEHSHLVVYQLNLLAFLDDFALGMALASLSAWWEGRPTGTLPRPVRALERFPALAWGMALITLWVVSTRIGIVGRLGEPIHRAQYLERHYLFSVVALGLALPAMFGDHRRGVVRRVLASRVLLYLGMVSYAVYLYHFAVLIQLENWGFTAFARHTTALLWFPAALGGGVLLATLSYYGVERPILALKRLVPERRRPQAGQTPPDPAPVPPPARVG